MLFISTNSRGLKRGLIWHVIHMQVMLESVYFYETWRYEIHLPSPHCVKETENSFSY